MTQHRTRIVRRASGVFFPRVPGPGVFFTPVEQDEIDNIDWEQSARRIFAGALILKAKLPLTMTPTDAELVSDVMDLAFTVDDQINVLRAEYRLHSKLEHVRVAEAFVSP